jgi:hypothetical protein
VILPDYEGYGVTRNNAHPYLYQELTARQVVDATRYGISLYKTSSRVDKVRHSFRSNWRSICVGYSQGGSVALATQRFIEQNGLTDELHLAGSVCGDGPYDMMATLMYYVKQHKEGNYCRRSCTRRTMCQCVCAELRWRSSNGNLIHPHLLFEWRGVV